jgi:hypothetical protein
LYGDFVVYFPMHCCFNISTLDIIGQTAINRIFLLKKMFVFYRLDCRKSNLPFELEVVDNIRVMMYS